MIVSSEHIMIHCTTPFLKSVAKFDHTHHQAHHVSKFMPKTVGASLYYVLLSMELLWILRQR